MPGQPSSSDDSRTARLDELLFDHIQRRTAGEQVSDDELIRRHPDLLPELAARLEILSELASGSTSRAAQRTLDHRDSPAASGMLTIRCAHCRQPVQVPADASLADITCASCGTHFSLAGAMETQDDRSSRILGHFQLIQRVGVGSFGTVWRARDLELEREVAVKIPHQGKLHAADVEQFLREARATAQLNHPSIVGVHEVGREGDTIFIVSDLVEGVPLADWLTARRPTFREAAELCGGIADALRHAHEAGVIHRDLKPQNIIIDSQHKPHLLDFGLARRDLGEITMTLDGHVLGTPAYMSAEQARGDAHQADHRTDIYSLGVILFELITGELPFRGNARMLIHQVLHDDPPSPRKLNACVPRDLETICLKCMEKEPARRYESSAALADELRRYLDGTPIVARPVSMPQRTWRWCRQKPVLAALILLLLLSLMNVSYFAHQANRRATESRASEDEANRQRDEARSHLYVARMRQARQDWEDGHLERMKQLLESCEPRSGEPDRRGWEWYYLNSLLHREQRTFRGHANRVGRVIWLPDGNRIVSAGADGAKAWDVQSGDNILSLTAGRDNGINPLDYAPPRGLLAFMGSSQVRVCELETGRGVQLIPREAWSLAFHPDGRRLAVAAPDQIEIWDLPAGGDDAEVEAGDRIPIKTFARPEYLSGDAQILCWSPDGKQLASGGGDQDGGHVWIWDVESGKRAFSLREAGNSVTCLAWSPDGGSLASGGVYGGEGNITVWNTLDGGKEFELDAHTGTTYCVTWNHDGSLLASAGQSGTVKTWHVETRKEGQTFRGHRGPARSVSWSPDGNQLASCGDDGTVRVWELAERSRTLGLAGFSRVAWRADGRRIAAAAGMTEGRPPAIEVFEAASGARVARLSCDRRGWLSSLSWNPKRPNLLAASLAVRGKGLIVWDLTDSQKILDAKTDQVFGIAFGPSGRWLAAGGMGVVKIWDVSTREVAVVLPGHAADVGSVAWSPDGRHLATTCYDQFVKVWDARSWKEVRSFRRADAIDAGDGQYSISWSPDGNLLAAGGENGVIHVWNVNDGRQLVRVNAHSLAVWSVAWNPDGTRIASGGEDRTLKLWDAATGEELLNFSGGFGVGSIAWSPDGLRLAASTGVGARIEIWDATLGY